MLVFKVAAALALAHQAFALPAFYNAPERMIQGCTIPEQGYGAHGAPVPGEELTFVLSDETGPVSTWVAGGIYTLTVSTAAPRNVWAHSSIGTLAPADPATHTQADACPEASFSNGPAPAPEHAFTWTAPATAEGCVVVSAAGAAAPTEAYQTNTVELCAEGAAPGAAPADAPAEAPVDAADAPAPTEEEPEEEPAEPDEAGEAPEAAETAETDAAFSHISVAGAAAVAAAVAAALM